MWIVKLALSRPYTFIVLALLILVLGPVTELSAESYAAVLRKTTVQSKKETCVASICTSAFKSGAVPPCGAASSTILDEGHRPSPSGSVHSVFRAVRVFLSDLVESSAFHEVSLGREVSIVFTSNGPLVHRWEANKELYVDS
jgi:hypothetical protein